VPEAIGCRRNEVFLTSTRVVVTEGEEDVGIVLTQDTTDSYEGWDKVILDKIFMSELSCRER
jgi:hypothetical protein